jgi:hypothetical protein
MSVEVVTVWAPRPSHEKWDSADWLKLIDLQRRSAFRYGATHTIVTDDELFTAGALPGRLIAELPRELMPAMIAGVIARLTMAPIRDDLLFLDVDALVARPLEPAFDRTFDIGLTRRANPDGVHINNGAMYVDRHAGEKAVRFFMRALARCGTHWGADQQAISDVASPVPETEGVELRGDTRISFLSMKTHNVIPKKQGKPHLANPFVVHFKGQTKEWAQTYADRFIFNEPELAYGVR